MRIVFVSILLFVLTSCAVVPEQGAERVALTPVPFADLDGWSKDSPAAALTAFQHSCAALANKNGAASMGIAGQVTSWQAVCAAAKKIPATDEIARVYFEEFFRPYAVEGRDGDVGLFTGYYMPELRGSLRREGAFQTPLYAAPEDKIEVDLGAFKADLKGQHIVGKLRKNALVPYDDRAAIAQGSLTERAKPLAWIDDPIGAFFLEIQGSGRLRLTDGSLLPVGYDGANGRAYTAIGRVLADRGNIDRPVTMPAIRAWLAAHPAQAQEAMNLNPSYVFFRRLSSEDAIGAQGVALTPQRSLAVDRDFLPLGVPVWVDTTDGRGEVLQRLMVAQDTGGAIKGTVRGDFFWGVGDEAAAQAGAMQSRGRAFILLPKTVTLHDD